MSRPLLQMTKCLSVKIPRKWRWPVLSLCVAVLVVLLQVMPRFMIANELYQRNLSAHPRLAQLPLPQRQDRIVIFAPHEDDETIGCSGYIQQAVEAGASVTVVMVTNGDYPRHSLFLLGKNLGFTPQSYIDLGYVRQSETLQAVQSYGLSDQQVIFLGYPNGPIYRMWLPTHWSPDQPASSVRTLCERSPYTNSLTPNAVYCGQSLLQDMETVLARVQPTVVITMHPNDTNADHWAVGAFSRFALAELANRGEAFARTCRVYSYIVHRMHWPAPMRYRPHMALYPPQPLLDIRQTDWRTLPLTPAQVQRKYAAIAMFRSQGGVFSPLLRAMARNNEVFGILPVKKWSRGPGTLGRAEIIDPSADQVITALQPQADIQRVTMTRARQRMVVTLSLRERPKSGTGYHFSLHAGNATPAERVIARYDYHRESVLGAVIQQGTLTTLTRRDVSVMTAGTTVTFDVPWPLREGAHGQRFFLLRAWTTKGEGPSILDQTATTMFRVLPARRAVLPHMPVRHSTRLGRLRRQFSRDMRALSRDSHHLMSTLRSSW